SGISSSRPGGMDAGLERVLEAAASETPCARPASVIWARGPDGWDDRRAHIGPGPEFEGDNMRPSIVGLLVVFELACGATAVIAAGGAGSGPGSAAESQYRPPSGKPPCDLSRPDVPSVDRRFPNRRPPCPPPGF